MENKTTTLYLLSGIPGSGKSTYIKNKLSGIKVVSPDEIRGELSGDVGDQSRNAEVWKTAFERLETLLSNGESVIFDATLVDAKAREQPISIGKKYNCKIVVISFDVSLETAIYRQTLRDRQVPSEVIQRFYDRFTIAGKHEGIDDVIVIKS